MLNKYRRWAALPALLALLVALTGCGIVVRQPTTFDISCSQSAAGTTPQTIPVHVVHTATATLVLVPVCLSGQGPYSFILDTGAAHSVVDRGLVGRLRLPVAGKTAPATGVACTVQAGQVQVVNWSVGQVPLRAQTLGTLPMAGAPGGPGIDGLLGSDVWSRFGQFRLDYRAGRLTLPAAEQATAPTAVAAAVTDPAHQPVPMTIVHPGSGTLALVPVTLDGHGPLMFVLDTGSSTSVVDQTVAQRLSLRPIGHPQRATGVSCATPTQPVHVSSWQLGTIPLHAQNVDSIPLAIPNLTGLLGSDILYHFNTVTVDYATGRLLPAS